VTELPPGWARTRLGGIAQPVRTSVNPADCPTLPYLGLEHVETISTKILNVASASLVRSTSFRFESGSTLYARLRPYLNKVCTPDFDGIGSGEFIIFPPSPFLAHGFLKYLLNQPRFVEFTSALDTGDRPRVNWTGIAGFEVGLPPVSEQKHIVAAIEEQFSRLDAGVAALEEGQKKIERMTAAVFATALEGRLVPQNSSEGDASELVDLALESRERRMLAAGHRRIPEPLDFVRDGLPPLPGSWKWVSLDTIAEVVGGITKDTKKQNAPGLVRVPYLRVANVQRGYLDLRDVTEIGVRQDQLAELRLLPGDILFNEGGDRDKLGRGWVWSGQIAPCVHQNHVFRARLYAGIIDPRLVSWWGNSFGQRWFDTGGKQTTNLASVSKTTLRSFPIPLPPRQEQARIVGAVLERLELAQRLGETIEQALARAAVLRSSILSAAFSGKLVPQNPNDEPASVLLERIAAERAASANGTQPARNRRAQPSLWETPA